MNKRQQKEVIKGFKARLTKELEGAEPPKAWEIKAYIRAERKKMKKLKRAGVL